MVEKSVISGNCLCVGDADSHTGICPTGELTLARLASAPVTPVNGMVYYNTTDNKIYFRENDAWNEIGGESFWQRIGTVVSPINEGDDLSIGGSFTLTGTTPNYIYGGNATGDDLFIYANSVDATPYLYLNGYCRLESASEIYMDLAGGTHWFKVRDATDTDLFTVSTLGAVDVISGDFQMGSVTIIDSTRNIANAEVAPHTIGTAVQSNFYGSGANLTAIPYPVTSVFTRTGDVVAEANDYTWAEVDKTVSSLNDVTTKRIGDATNHTDWAADGTQTMGGTARVKKVIQFFPYNMGAIADTYNGIVCGAAGLGSLNGAYFKTFDDGQAVGTAEATNMQLILPGDYVDGTDIEIKFAWCTGGVENVVRWQAGLLAVSDTDTYSPGTYVWGTPQDITVPGVVWERDTATFTISGTGIVKGDDVSVVVFRDADNAADTFVGDAYVAVVAIKYTSDRIGE